MINNLAVFFRQSIEKVQFWMGVSRAFSLPVTLIAWLVAFIFALINGGNVYYGLLALVGVCFAHLAANLFDDYMDYKKLVLTDFKNAQDCKCERIKDGSISLNQVLRVVIFYCVIALASGGILTFLVGWPTLIFIFVGAVAVLFYSKATYVGLGELFVFITYGPALFGGVYFVMTKNLSLELFLISIPISLMIVGLLHTHTLLDYGFDKSENKKTLTCLLASKQKSIWALGVMFFLAYFFVGIIGKWLFLSYLSIPFAVIHIKSLVNNSNDFMQTLLTARNLAVWFSILVCVGLVLNR